MIFATLKNNRLVTDCDRFINIECEDYYRKINKDIIRRIRISCVNYAQSRTEYFAAVSASKNSSQLIKAIHVDYPLAVIVAINDNKENIAKEEGLEDILKSVKKLVKVEFNVKTNIDECSIDECDC